MHRMSLTVGVALLAAGAVFGALNASPLPHQMREGLVFDLGFVNPTTDGTSMSSSDIQDFTKWSATKKIELYKDTGFGTCSSEQAELYGTPEPMTVTNCTMKNAIYPGRTDACNSVHLPQTTYRDGVKNYVYPNGILLKHVIPAGSNLTVYVRFRWDGRVVNTNRDIFSAQILNNGNRTYGYSIGLGVYSDSAKKESDYGYVQLGGSVVSDNFYDIQTKTNVWTDLAVTFKTTFTVNGDAVTTNTTAVIYLAKAGSQTLQVASKSVTGKMIDPQITNDWRDYFSVGGLTDNYTTQKGTLPTEYQTIGEQSLFRGDIATIQIYSRTFSEAEICALFAGECGQAFQAGISNGNADEFGADADDLADVFETDSMEVRRLRKNLTAEHPSLTLRYPVRSDEVKLKKALVLVPLLDGTAETVTLRAYANGAPIGKLYLHHGVPCVFTLPKSAFVRDADGKSTLRLERTGDLSGTVRFDYLALGGSWQVGQRDRSASDAGFADRYSLRPNSSLVPTRPSQIAGGNGGVGCLFTPLYGMNGAKTAYHYPTESIVFDVPGAVAATCPSELTISLANSADAIRDLAVYANGKFKWHQKGWSANYPEFTIPFAAGELKEGFNELVVSNATCDFTAVPGSSDYRTLSFDHFSFRAKLPRVRGTTVFVR